MSNPVKRRTAATALAAMFITACQVGSPSLPSSWAQSAPRLRPPGELANREELLEELDRAQKKWIKERPLEYELTVVRGYNNPGPYVSVVRGMKLLRSRGGYRPNGHDIAPSSRSVEGLFDEARIATLFPIHDLEVTFDERLGYPKRARIDPIKGAIDDETTWIASVKVIVP